uniref:Uncharacterized protein n=1 Tax=Ciona intestinalis TaxID=7719 RepID=H2XSX8_CIOIN
MFIPTQRKVSWTRTSVEWQLLPATARFSLNAQNVSYMRPPRFCIQTVSSLPEYP